jgi:hypothetical protein
VAVLELLSHLRYIADNPWKLLAQCVNETIKPIAAGAAEAVGVTSNFDVKDLACIPKKFSMGFRLFDTVA